MAKILVVDDEPVLVETLAYNLQREGYIVSTATNGRDALASYDAELPDLILLDIMLPELDGLEVCRRLRAKTNVPIIMLTAKDEEADRVVGLEIGADDYITKPFSLRELIARVKAALRRSQLRPTSEPEAKTSSQTMILRSGDLSVDLSGHQASLGDEPLVLKPKEYDLLAYFARNRGRALTRDELMERVWDHRSLIDTRTLDVHVRWLRRKIEVDPGQPTRIVTVRGMGYKFVG